MTVTFFGHRNAPQEIANSLTYTLIALIEKENATKFYVGNQGSFDSMVLTVLKTLKRRYPHITYDVVLAYLPACAPSYTSTDHINTIFPEGLERVPQKYAISKRNRWLIEHSDLVITYVTHPFGGAAACRELAIKKGKRVIDLADNGCRGSAHS